MGADGAGEEHVRSRDGSRIGYLRQGSGPGLVLVQGAMGTAQDYRELTDALSPYFTVLAVDRRGRGMSPRPYDAAHDIARDVEDVDAVLAATGARRVFGLSSGAVVTLEAARTLPLIARAAVYEPPFYPDGISRDGIRLLDADIERGDWGSALVRSLLVAETAPALIRVLPLTLARVLARGVLWLDGRRPGPGTKLVDLLPGIRYDFHVVAGVDGRMGTYAAVDTPVLLLSGTRSQAFLRQSTRALADIIPGAEHVELAGLSHSGPWNRSRGGSPATVAAALRDFFT